MAGQSAYAACTVNGVAETGQISRANLDIAIATDTDDITGCDVSAITDMSLLFYNATAFNQDIGSWNVGNVQDMSNMFTGAAAFNQDISSWDVSSVSTDAAVTAWGMGGMFSGATAFN